MPLAITHILSAVILVDLYRDYFAKHRKYFSSFALLIAGLAGLLPDFDIILEKLVSYFTTEVPLALEHGRVMHTPFFALLFLITGAILWKQNKKKIAIYLYIITIGIFLHIVLDHIIGGGIPYGIMWLYPFSLETWKVHLASCYLNLPNMPESLDVLALGALDTILLLIWILHLEIRHKISRYR